MMNIIVMGECMVELSSSGKTFQQGFAGDVYNTAVYLKRLVKQHAKVGILTAVGCDELSHEMLDAFKQEQVDTELVAEIKDKQTGLYLIKTSADGERRFTYWRGNSAAKQTLSHLSSAQKTELEQQTDIFYFSGISLAILDKTEIALFWQLLKSLKQRGTKIVFDTNYREKLWHSEADAKAQYHKAFTLSDIVFPGGEDFSLLYGIDSFDAIATYLTDYSIPQVIIKNGVEGVLCISAQQRDFINVVPVETVIDTTSAGDAFNAGYLAAALADKSMAESAVFGATISAFVIQHKGAIVNSSDFTDFIKSL